MTCAELSRVREWAQIAAAVVSILFIIGMGTFFWREARRMKRDRVRLEKLREESMERIRELRAHLGALEGAERADPEEPRKIK